MQRAKAFGVNYILCTIITIILAAISYAILSDMVGL